MGRTYVHTYIRIIHTWRAQKDCKSTRSTVDGSAKANPLVETKKKKKKNIKSKIKNKKINR